MYQWNERENNSGCLFCTGVDSPYNIHERRTCPLFKKLKRNSSAYPYIADKLKDNDADGYAAAGIFLWRRSHDNNIEVLLAREYRKRNDLLNFLGGKRLRRDTPALKCAIDKVDLETGHQLSEHTINDLRNNGCPLVIWSSASLYALFLYELVDEGERDVDLRALGVQNSSAKRLEWVSRKDLIDEEFISSEFHEYSIEMLEECTDRCEFMTHLEHLFPKKNTVAKRLPKVMMKSKEYFDVLQSIRTTLALTRPDQVQLPAKPSWLELKKAVTVLHGRDLTKLQKKFNVNTFALYIDREPTGSEMKMCSLAEKIVKGIIWSSHSVNEKQVMTQIEELYDEIAVPYEDACTDEDVIDLSVMLEKITVKGKVRRR